MAVFAEQLITSLFSMDVTFVVGLEGFAKLCVYCAETMKPSNCRENDGFFRENIETIGNSAQRC